MIATYDRWVLLRQALRSLRRSIYKDFSVHVIVDGNPLGIPGWLKKAGVELIILPNRGDVVAAWGVYTRLCESGSLFQASDDLIFHPDCLSASVYAMRAHFPKGRGVIGINQLQNGIPRGRHYAFTLMNRAYIDHFPDRIIFCPDYIHFCSDREHGEFAQRSGCFSFCKSARVDHIRVDDLTTQIGRKEYKPDRAIYRARRDKGLLWGQTFELIRREL